MRNLLLAAVTASAFTAAGLACAQAPGASAAPAQPRRTPAEVLKELDKDGDGGISKLEWVAPAGARTAARYDEIDTNKDGHISLAELTVGMAQQQRDREAAAAAAAGK